MLEICSINVSAERGKMLPNLQYFKFDVDEDYTKKTYIYINYDCSQFSSF